MPSAIAAAIRKLERLYPPPCPVCDARPVLAGVADDAEAERHPEFAEGWCPRCGQWQRATVVLVGIDPATI